MRSAGNFRVVLCGGDGSEAGRLVSFSTIIAANRWVVPDSCHGVGDSSGSHSRGRAATVSDVFRGRSTSYSSPSCYNPGSRSEWSTLLDSPQV